MAQLECVRPFHLATQSSSEKAVRLEFARLKQTCDVEWSRVLSADENKMVLDSPVNYKYYWADECIRNSTYSKRQNSKEVVWYE